MRFADAPSGKILMASDATLRDYFAGLALQGWMTTYNSNSLHPGMQPAVAESIACNCYRIADAMLEERAK